MKKTCSKRVEQNVLKICLIFPENQQLHSSEFSSFFQIFRDLLFCLSFVEFIFYTFVKVFFFKGYYKFINFVNRKVLYVQQYKLFR